MKFKIFKYDNASSSNDIAMKLIKVNKMKKGCVITKAQTYGRGRYGRKWISLKGNLFTSIFFPLKENYPPFNEFSIINPLIISNVIKQFCMGMKINIKFPNDILLNEKKVCGILQEIISFKEKKFIVIGIGINIVSNPDISKKYKTTNILRETKRKISIENIVNNLIFSYEDFFINLKNYNYKNLKKKAELMVV